MFSGGSGITPFISIIRELLHKTNPANKIPQIVLVAAFKRSVDLGILDLILPLSGTSHDISHLQLQIRAYVTQESGPTMENQHVYQTVWFKPDGLDAPVSAILGRNGWLWLGVIIISSSVVFLALIALITRFYINPVDHNTDMIYSYTVRSVFNMLFVCISIAITAIIAFLWNKKRDSTNMRPILIDRCTDTNDITSDEFLVLQCR